MPDRSDYRNYQLASGFRFPMPQELPRDPTLTARRHTLVVEEELLLRLALHGEFPHLRHNRRWKARINALWRGLKLDEGDGRP